MATSDPRYVLPYHHFTVVLNKQRRLAFFTAVNIDGSLAQETKRANDRWFFDPRVPKEEQAGEDVYTNNDLDLGHLVRRLDPTWGTTPDIAKLANDDTFHYTNCTPQHKDFNRNKTRWAGMEDYILNHADNLHFKVSVFTGPVLAADDDAYRDIRRTGRGRGPLGTARKGQSGSSGTTSPVFRPRRTARVIALVPKRSRISSTAASSAVPHHRSKGSAS
jgi:endonuclease G